MVELLQSGTYDAALALGILAIMFALFVSEKWPTEVVALGAAAAMLITGILPYEAALNALFGPRRLTHYRGLLGKRSAQAIGLAFDEGFTGDRVAAFIEGNLRVGTPLCIPAMGGMEIGRVTSIEQVSVSTESCDVRCFAVVAVM